MNDAHRNDFVAHEMIAMHQFGMQKQGNDRQSGIRFSISLDAFVHPQIAFKTTEYCTIRFRKIILVECESVSPTSLQFHM